MIFYHKSGIVLENEEVLNLLILPPFIFTHKGIRLSGGFLVKAGGFS